jgi:hypothetical protein
MYKIFKYKKKDNKQQDESMSNASRKGFSKSGGITRMAKKYVIFDVETGKVVFEYGGVNKKYYTGYNKKISPLIDPSPEKDVKGENKIYELGCYFKEIREDKFKPKIYFYYTGDFLNEDLKKDQIAFQWSINFVEIPIEDIFSQHFIEEGTQAMINLVYERIYEQIKNL